MSTVENQAATRAEVERKLGAIFSQALGRDSVGVSEMFFELGGDSLMAVAVADIISSEFACPFEVTQLLQYPSIELVAGYILSCMRPETASGNAETMVTRPAPSAESPVDAPAEAPAYYADSVAIIGISCRFPGARDHHEFWENLLQGRASIALLSSEELRRMGVPERLIAHPDFVPVRTTLTDKELFDAEFFRIATREAEAMDPQLRLLLAHAWAAVEDAGYVPVDIPDTSVFVSTANHFFGRQTEGTGQVFTLEHFADYQKWLLAQSGTAPTAISYRMGFTGPSYSVNSNCSSSLVGLKLACQALLQGESRCALVGAASVSSVDGAGYLYQKGLNLSSDGRVRAFDASADGMVAGEGVAVLLLKRAKDAVADGDHIYSIIRSVAMNNDGAAKAGYYAPSVQGQVDVIERALEAAHIDPESISFVECHGTGTAVGDPIELAALTKAYRRFTDKTQFCGVGSVKSNIGHMDTAAGLAGVIKASLALEAGEVPPTINVQHVNEKLKLADSPFFVLDHAHKLAPARAPHRAAVSAFGIGGTNTHALLEQASVRPTAQRGERVDHGPYLVPLSARSEGRLREYAAALAAFVDARPPAQSDEQEHAFLARLAYTLQVGRQAMNARLAFLVRTREELAAALGRFARGEQVASSWFCADIKSAQLTSAAAALMDDEDMATLVDSWLAKRKFDRLLERWTAGVAFDWKRLYREAKPSRISLPTYPFEPRRVPLHARQPATPAADASARHAKLHPLLHRNTSDVTSLRFSSSFRGEESFLSDHRVRGERVLPAVAHLEMARAAVEHAVGAQRKVSIRLHDVMWARPAMVRGQGLELHVAVRAEDARSLAYEIFGFEPGGERRVTYSRGRALLGEEDAPLALDISRELAQPGRKQLSGNECYARFTAAGIEYGPHHRVIETAYVWQDKVIARLSLGDDAAADASYVLHPSIADGALQAVAGLIADDAGGAPLSIPFSLAYIEARRPTEANMWAVVRRQAAESADDRSARFDVQLVDDQGGVSVAMKGFTTRTVDDGAAVRTLAPGSDRAVWADTSSDLVGDLLLKPVWEPVAISAGNSWPAAHDKVVVLSDPASFDAIRAALPQAMRLPLPHGANVDQITQALRDAGTFDHILWVVPSEGEIGLESERVLEAQGQGALFGFRLVKSLLAAGYANKALGLTVLTTQTQRVIGDERVRPAHAGVLGLLGSLAKEQRAWKVRAIDVSAEAAPSWHDVLQVAPHPAGEPYAHRADGWYAPQMLACSLSAGEPQAQSARYKSNGVYVVVGGAGGLGVVWSEMMVRDYQAHVIWIGRREEDGRIRSEIQRLAKLGPAPRYIRADASERAELRAAYAEIKRHHAHVDGVVQATLELRDHTLATMDEASFLASLRAKVEATVHIAQTFAAEPLDFFLLFSSILSFVKSAGQSNYAAGCVFQDAFGQWLAHLLAGRVRVMNWGFWGTTGSVATPLYRERMAKAGIDSIEPGAGLLAIRALLEGPNEQLAFLRTSRTPEPGFIRTDERLSVLPALTASVLDALPAAACAPAEGLHSCTGPEHLDVLVGRLLKCQLEAVGALRPTRLSVAEGASLLPAQYRRWYEESLRCLAARGELEYDGEASRALGPSYDVNALWQSWEKECLASQQDASLKAQVALVNATIRALPDILRGKTPATSVIFPSSSVSLVEGVYKNNPTADYFNDALARLVADAVQRWSEMGPEAKLRILEIGAGTGGTSAAVFAKLAPYSARIAEYCYTDLSRAFLMHAQRTYGPQVPYLKCQVVDVEKALGQQGIDLGAYDIVIATNVLHATRNVRATLRNVKAALRRNGILLLNEMSQNSLFMHLTFGLLDGWWLYDDALVRLPGCPLLAPESWRRALEREGFGRVLFPTAEAGKLGQQVVVAESNGVVRYPLTIQKAEARAARVAPAPTTRSAPFSPIKTTREDGLRAQIRACVASALQVEAQQIDDQRSFEDYGVDSIIAIDVINALNEKLGTTLQTITLFEHQTVEQLTRHVLAAHPAVVTDDGAETPSPASTGVPESGAISFDEVRSLVRHALARALGEAEGALRDEVSFADAGVDSIIAIDLISDINARLNLTLQTIVLFEHGDVPSLSRHILGELDQARGHLMNRRERPEAREGWAVAGSREARAAPGPEASQAFAPLPLSPSRDGQRYHRVLVDRPQDVADLRIVESTMSALRPDEVRIGVRAFSLNFGDLLCVRGLYPTMPPYPFTPGAEVSGVVVEVGESVERFGPGDEVVALLGHEFGGHATMATCPEAQLMVKPASLSFEAACSLPVVAMTMIECFRRADVQPGESILIQTATGGTGLIAVQLAQACGAEVFATAGSSAKLDYLRALGVKHCINYVDVDFEDEIRRMTRGRGVDVIINTLGGDAMQKGLRCLAPRGRYVEIAMTAMRSAKRVDLSVLSDNQTFHSVDMRRLLLADPARAERCRRELTERLASGVIRPTVSKVFEMQEIRSGYALLADRANIGKVVIRVPDALQLKAPERTEPASAHNGQGRGAPAHAAPGSRSRAASPATVEAGLRALTVPGERPLAVALFYPSTSPARAIPLGGFTARVATSGVPLERTRGLLVLSHGYAGGELVHDNLALKLAREGYVVACLKHAGDNWLDRSLVGTPRYFLERPRQVSRVIDALLADREWQARIPQGAVGAIGHSMGGYTVLALLGAQLDPAKVVDYCRNPPNQVTQALVGAPDEAQLRAIDVVLSAPQERILTDDRIRAAVVMAPCWSVFDHRSLSGISTPLSIYLAEHDSVIDRTYDGASLAQLMPRAQIHEARGAGHFSFTALRERTAMPVGEDVLARFMVDPPDFDRTALHRRLEHEVTAFFDSQLALARAEEGLGGFTRDR